MKRIITGILALGVSFGGLTAVATPANAAVYGQPGKVNCSIISSKLTAPKERTVRWECDYRTSTGMILRDVIQYDSTKRFYG